MSRGALKLLAILLMTGNHIAQVFLSPNTVSYHLFLTLGYATAPLMCAFLSDGFIYTHDRKAYGIRLLDRRTLDITDLVEERDERAWERFEKAGIIKVEPC